MSTAFAVSPGPLYLGRSPVRDRAYLAFVRDHHSCCVPNCRRGHIESAHTGARGLGTKSDDRNAIPLCRWHHRQAKDSLHDIGPVKFARLHRVDFAGTIAELNREYGENITGA